MGSENSEWFKFALGKGLIKWTDLETQECRRAGDVYEWVMNSAMQNGVIVHPYAMFEIDAQPVGWQLMAAITDKLYVENHWTGRDINALLRNPEGLLGSYLSRLSTILRTFFSTEGKQYSAVKSELLTPILIKLGDADLTALAIEVGIISKEEAVEKLLLRQDEK